MSATELKSVISRAPHDVGRAANDFGELVFSCDTAHKVNALPASFQGQRVTVHAIGGAADVAFSDRATAEVDTSVAATDAGAAAKVGRTIPSGAITTFVLPKLERGKTLYFVREGAATSIRVGLASG